MTADQLRAFEEDIANEFNAGHIPYPVHLSSGNEVELLTRLWQVRPWDWFCTTWRSHLHCLIKGVPPDELKQAIMSGHSIALNFPKYRVVSSAIAGGICPIALGIAMGIKRSNLDELVYCFVGDMVAHSGAFYECYRYSMKHDLPIKWFIEDNGISVFTPTGSVWPLDRSFEGLPTRYVYKNKYPHSGAGQFVKF